MTDKPRLIEHAFPLKQASLDSVHEKNVRHGHISTLHIWPARRPLAACRAALIATLLPDPSAEPKPAGMSDDAWHEEIIRRRRELCEKIGGKLVKKIERKKMPNGETVEREKEQTEGGILHWGLETENKDALDWFRQEIKKANGGRAPKVLDPFAGGGAIPLEAMRLGCEATAVDINPVAWFILKCTLEYPQKLAGKTHPLPDFILDDEEFMNAFYKAHPHLVRRTKKTVKQIKEDEDWLPELVKEDSGRVPKADIAWHVRAWGQWVLNAARSELAPFYPTYADFEPIDLKHPKPFEKQKMRLVQLKAGGTPNIDALNKDFSQGYLIDKRNPRWVAKPTVAYLWARTVTCKNCRVTIPLLKTRWLCKKDNKRVLLKVEAVSRRLPGPLEGRSAVSALEEMQERDEMSRQTFDKPRDETSRLQYFDPNEPVSNLSGNLPHWRQDGITYFVTFRLADSMPQEKLEQWADEREAWLNAHPEPLDATTKLEYFTRFPARFQEWLDAGYGECILANPKVRQIVEDSLRHFDGDRYRLDEFVIMPNHVHVLVTPNEGYSLSDILHTWKSYTAHEINKLVERSGSVWQKESFDHIIRNSEQMEQVRQYIRDNPVSRSGVSPFSKTFTYARRDVASTCTQRDVASTIVFGIEANVPVKGGNTAQRREHDKRISAGTMSRSGAKCPCCGTIMTMEDIRFEGKAGRLGSTMTAVVVDGQNGKEYRLPTEHELRIVEAASSPHECKNAVSALEEVQERNGMSRLLEALDDVFAQIPYGMPSEPTPKSGSGASRAFSVDGYGFDQWKKLFTHRQLLALGTFVKWTRMCRSEQNGYPDEWREALSAYSTCIISRTADYMAQLCVWENGAEEVKHLFMRWALPITWDFAEANPFTPSERFFAGGIKSAWRVLLTFGEGSWSGTLPPNVINRSAIVGGDDTYDLVFTDPPYYDAIPYSDLMDFFYLWLRRSMADMSSEYLANFMNPLSPKWCSDARDGELIDDSSRHAGNGQASKSTYEDGMFRAFSAAYNRTAPNGHMVVVFANKKPDAWETLVAAVIRAGFCVNGSWPIATEMPGGLRNLGRASLSSSVWLVCKKRPATARPGWDNQVLEEMRKNIRERLREYWDAGIRGPDFVWAATGPAMEAYSKHPVVKKANEPGPMTVSEFLTHVRRIVVDFVVGRVLSGDKEGDADIAAADRLDEPTAYYLLHRHDFGMDEAPAGACILYAISCGISDRELAQTWDLIGFTKGKGKDDEDEEADADAESDDEMEDNSGSKVKLRTWAQRKGKSLGYEAPGGKPIPLIDRVHRMMHLWKAGDLSKVDEYIDGNGLRRQELFKRLLQSLIELSPHGSEERSLLESISNHIQARGAVKDEWPTLFPKQEPEGDS